MPHITLDVINVLLGLALAWYVYHKPRSSRSSLLLILGYSVLNLVLMIGKLIPPDVRYLGAALNLALVICTKALIFKRFAAAGVRTVPAVGPSSELMIAPAPIPMRQHEASSKTIGPVDHAAPATTEPAVADRNVTRATKSHWRRLRRLMEERRPYLDPDLQQADVAQLLGISSRTLSRTLRRQADTNFNGFVNSYRVEEAKRLLTDGEHAHLTTEALGARAGFNSRVTFYRAFRELTGMSPAKYRGAYLSDGAEEE